MLVRSTLAVLGGSVALSQAATVQYLGVAIAGGEFGCAIDGTCPPDQAILPTDVALDQMTHFTVDDAMNMFRIPISWQWLTNSKIGALDPTNFKAYDDIVQACLGTGAYCMLDVHNFARYDTGIIGQTPGGPTDEDFVGLWTQLATWYSNDSRVLYEIMNEPHELDVPTWAATCQKVVNAIRKVSPKQMILLPGTNFDSAGSLVSSGSAAALLNITNPGGGTDGLLLDIHKYLDIDNSGTNLECVTDNVDAFKTIGDYLRKAKRQGLVSETGASSDPTCLTSFCAQNQYIMANSDVFVGLVVWAAGSFTSAYALNLSPTKNKDGTWTDAKILTQCVLAPWNNGTTHVPVVPATTRTSTSTSATSTAATATATGPVVTQKPATSGTVISSSPTSTPSNSGAKVGASFFGLAGAVFALFAMF